MKFTVITVTYNCVETIERALCSVLKQEYDNIEYIVIDGASTDGTVDVIKDYADRIDYFVSEKDEGIYDAFNKGVSLSGGDIISFLNGDDYYIDNDVFNKLNDIFSNIECDVITGRINIGGIPSRFLTEREFEGLYEYMVFMHPATFVKKEVFEKIGVFDKSIRFAADYDWMLRVYRSGAKIVFDSNIYTWFDPNGLSSSMECQIETIEIALKYSFYDKKSFVLPRLIERLDDLINKYCLEKICEDEGRLKKFITMVLQGKERVVLWGMGSWGKLLYEAFIKSEVVVDSIIDESMYNRGDYCNTPVVLYDREEVKDIVVISTMLFESDVKKRLNHDGFREGLDYISFSMIKGVLASLQSELLCDELGHRMDKLRMQIKDAIHSI